MEKGWKMIWAHARWMGSAGAAWAQVANHCWAQARLLQETLASIRLALAALGERAKGHRPPRRGQQSKRRDLCFLVPGSHLHQHHRLWDLVLLDINPPPGSIWPWVTPSSNLPCHYCSGPATSHLRLICPSWHLPY